MSVSSRVGLMIATVLAVGSAACGSHAVAVDPESEVPSGAVAVAAQEVISVQEHWSGFEETTRTVIGDAEEWAEAWNRMHAQVTPQPDLPQIDFGASVVVLAAMGSRPSTGYSVTIESVHAHDGALYVSVLERAPGTSCVVGGALTAPVHVVQVARQGSEAHFNVRTETLSC